MRRTTHTGRSGHWLTILTIVVFVMAAVGAGFALYTLAPVYIDHPNARYSLATFSLILVATFLIIVLASRLRRR